LHCEGVGSLVTELGRRFGLDEERLRILRLSGLLHDVGKIGLRHDLLFSREQLTPTQVEEVKTHVQTAVRLIRSIHGAEEIAQIVASHHEALDGSGYPLGARGEAISLEASILSVADVFVALTEDRPYRAAMTSPQALDVIRPFVGSKLDPRCFAALEGLVREGRPERSFLFVGSASERPSSEPGAAPPST
jgi:putative nucleotidyltransferase with HDIG domain